MKRNKTNYELLEIVDSETINKRKKEYVVTAKKNFCYRFKKLRDLHGFSQRYAAEHLGRNPRVVEHWEQGDSLPRTDTLLYIANTYNASIDSLLGLRDDTHPTAYHEWLAELSGLSVQACKYLRGLGSKQRNYKPERIIMLNTLISASGFELLDSLWEYLSATDSEEEINGILVDKKFRQRLALDKIITRLDKIKLSNT